MKWKRAMNWVVSLGIGSCAALLTGCDAQGANAEFEDADGGATPPTFQAPEGPVTFKSVPLWSDDDCPAPGNGRGASFAVISSARVLVAGCDLFEVNSETGSVVTLEDGVGSVSKSGRTVAVLGARGLGLSLDGGKSFDWTEWELVRCQGSPVLAAGDDFAVVGCVGGVGAWRGKGTSFEELPSLGLPIDPFLSATGNRLVARTFDGLFESLDSATTFKQLAVTGTLDVDHAEWFAITETELLAAGGGSLYAAPNGTGAFVQRSEAIGRYLTYNEGIVVRSSSDGSSLGVSADAGKTFLEVTASDASLRFGIDSHYGAGYLYSINAGTLLIGKVSE